LTAEVRPISLARNDSESSARIVAKPWRQNSAAKGKRFVSELPLSSAGKVLRRQMRRPYWEGNERQI
jgi:acyl-CoA synthetase (AMP-forming)/AMP-acid ligase II